MVLSYKNVELDCKLYGETFVEMRFGVLLQIVAGRRRRCPLWRGDTTSIYRCSRGLDS